MGRFTFDFGWSRRVPEHEGSLCRVLEIHAPGSLLEYGGSAVEIVSKDLSIDGRFGYRREEWVELVRLLIFVLQIQV